MIFQLQSVPGHFSHTPADRCGCSFWMCTCLQVGGVIPTEIGQLLQFCQLFPFEGAVYPIPAETRGNPGSHWDVALHCVPFFLSEQNLSLFLLKQRPGDVWSPPGNVSEHRQGWLWAGSCEGVGEQIRNGTKINPYPWHRVRPALLRSSDWSSCCWISPRFNFWVFSALRLWKVNSGMFSDI